MLPPVVMRLLTWLRFRRQPRTSAATWLANLLATGDVTLAALNREARAAGISYRAIWRARRAIGAELIRGNGRDRPSYYRLCGKPTLPRTDDPAEFVPF